MQAAGSHFAPVYLAERFVFRIAEFFRRWYLLALKGIFRATMRCLSSLDRRFALKITLLHFFTPLYGDESFMGRVLGVVFRSMRIAVALALYLSVLLAAVVAYLVWASIPVYLVAKVMGI